MISPAKLYAQVLFDINEECYPALCELEKGLNPESLEFFSSSLIPLKEKQKVIAVFDWPPFFKGFLNQLAKRRRWKALPQIISCYRELMDKKEGRVRGFVSSAQKLSSEDEEEIKNFLKDFFDCKTVLLQIKEDFNLIHGIRVEAGGFCFDPSVLCHLKQFKARVQGYGKAN